MRLRGAGLQGFMGLRGFDGDNGGLIVRSTPPSAVSSLEDGIPRSDFGTSISVVHEMNVVCRVRLRLGQVRYQKCNKDHLTYLFGA